MWGLLQLVLALGVTALPARAGQGGLRGMWKWREELMRGEPLGLLSRDSHFMSVRHLSIRSDSVLLRASEVKI